MNITWFPGPVSAFRINPGLGCATCLSNRTSINKSKGKLKGSSQTHKLRLLRAVAALQEPGQQSLSVSSDTKEKEKGGAKTPQYTAACYEISVFGKERKYSGIALTKAKLSLWVESEQCGGLKMVQAEKAVGKLFLEKLSCSNRKDRHPFLAKINYT